MEFVEFIRQLPKILGGIALVVAASRLDSNSIVLVLVLVVGLAAIKWFLQWWGGE